jgi:hypothetical protein
MSCMRGMSATAVLQRLVRVLALATALSMPSGTLASVVVPMTLDELARGASHILDAQVIAVHVTADTGRIERVVSLRVLERWKGEVDAVVHVRLPGGTIGRTRTLVTGVPELEEGARFVLFLDRTPSGAYRVLGLHQGAWRVVASPRDGVLSVGPAPAVPPTAGRVTRGDGSRRTRRLDVFRRDVQAHLEQGR